MDYAKGRPLRFGRGRRQTPVPKALLDWLREHPAAWSGWPTFDAHDWQDRRARLARLEAAGAPQGLLASLAAVNTGIARLRLERRARLERQCRRAGLDGLFRWTGC